MKNPLDLEAAVSRRSLLKGMGATAGLATLPGVLDEETLFLQSIISTEG